MKKIKYNLKEMLADVAKDEAGSKPVHRIISQAAIAEMLKKAKGPATEASRQGS